MQRIGALAKHTSRLRIETFGMALEDFGCRDRHRRIEEHLCRWRQPAALDALVQDVKDFLGALERESGNNDVSAPRESAADRLVKLLNRGFKSSVKPISICRFHDD